jgi:glycosyltransferase involved in cell wall biosynthesis
VTVENLYLYVHDLRSSGVVRDAMTYARRIGRERPVTLVAGYAQGFFAEEAARGDFRLKTLAAEPGAFARQAAALRLRNWLTHEPPGLLFSLGNLGHSAAYLATRRLGHIRRAYRISNEVARDDGVRGSLRTRWMKMLLRDAVRIVLVGQALGRAPLFAQALATGHAVAVPSAVNLARAARLATQPAPHPWATEDVPVVLGIGRLRPQKNFDLLIEGVGLARKSRRLRLVIVGGGSAGERARLDRLARKAGLGEDFLLAGETDNVFAWLARAAVFVLSSRWEGSSLALLEALAVGTPVVASALAGDAAQVLDEGLYGRLFDGLGAEALAAAILDQSSPDPIRPADRAKAYSEDAITDIYAKIVGQALAPGSGRSPRA